MNVLSASELCLEVARLMLNGGDYLLMMYFCYLMAKVYGDKRNGGRVESLLSYRRCLLTLCILPH